MSNAYSRAGNAWQRNEAGVWVLVAPEVAPEEHWAGGEKGFRIDPLGVNRLLNSRNPVTHTPPNLPAGTHCLWVEGTGSAEASVAGTPVATATAGAHASFVLGGSTAVLFTKTGSLTLWQCEAGKSPTSFIETAGAIVTRQGARLATDLVNATCQEMTFYIRLREVGDPGSSLQRIFHFGSVAGPAGGPYWTVFNGTGTNNFSARIHDGTITQNISSFGSYLYTDEIELRAWINLAEGKHHLTVTKNRGVESASGDSPTFTMPGAFSAALMNTGGMDLAAGLPMTVMGVALVKGIQNLSLMREQQGPLASFASSFPGLIKTPIGFGVFS